jgi:thioesterase domain-containing protein
MQLVQLWQKTLRIRPIGIHDNFFGLGGHSLLAVTLFDQISRVTGKVLPLSALLQAPTIAQQALLLRQQAWQPQWSSLVAVRSGGSKPPIFLVPPARGTALSFIKLARHLDPEQPIYSFDPIGLDGKQKPLDTVEAIAAHYLHDLCLFQPEGPYLLGGMCVGAHIAFEMVRQLKSRGAAVDCLLILDAGAPANGPDWHWTPDKRDLAHYSRRLVELMKTRTLPPLLKKKWRQIEKLFNQRRYYLEQIQETQSKAGHRYIATPLAQQMFLVQSQQYANRPEHRTRWATLAVEGLIHHTVPDTTHKSLIATNDQHISCLAAHLQRHLDQLDHQQAKTNK